MALSYFGYQDTSGATSTTWGEFSLGNNSYTTGFTCPGIGTQNVGELSLYTYGSGNIRLGVYNSAGNSKLVEGTAEVAVSGASPSWQGHMTAAACGNGTLTGGTTYRIFATEDNSGVYWFYKSPGSNNSCCYAFADYTGGLPASMPGDSLDNDVYLMRCGVEPAAAGRTTKNTDAWNLGMFHGMGFRMT